MPFRQPFSYADSMGKWWWVIKLEPISALSSQYDRLFYSLLWLTTKKISKVPVTGLLWRESTSNWWIFHTKTSVLRKVFHVVTSPIFEAMKIHTRKWLILRQTSCNVRNYIDKLLAIECIIIDIMSMSNTTGILFPYIKWLIHWSLFVLNSVVLYALPK